MVKKFLDKKYTKISLFLLLILISGFTFYFLVKADNPDDNKFTINGLKVTSVKDGLPDGINPDTSAEVWVDTTSYDKTTGSNPGTDNSSTNGVVRNFDSISYNLKFNLVAKDSQTVDTSSARTVYVDMIFPGNFDGAIGLDADNKTNLIHSNDGNYVFGSVEFNVEPGQDINRTVTIYNVDASNNDTIEPIIIIRESTDNDTRSVRGLTEEEAKAIDFSTTTDYNFVRSDSYCESGVLCETTVTGVENYNLELYNASTSRDNVITSTTPIAVGIALDTSSDKGMKGLVIPSTISFVVELPSSNDNYSFSYQDGSIKNYNSTAGDPSIVIDSEHDFPNVGNGSATATAGNDCSTGNCINVTIDNIGHKIVEVENGHKYINSTIFTTAINRNNYTEDIGYSIKATYAGKTSNELGITDRLGKYVGEFTSKINYYDPSVTVYTPDNRKPDGLAVLNYGQQFVIGNELKYGVSSGTELEDLTNYIKIDNDAIKVVNSTTSNVPVEVSVDGSTVQYNITYGFGKWNSTYFEINSDDASCSSIGSVSDLSKEELMNLYGGPCIRPTSNFKWSTSATESTEQFEDEDLLSYGPLVVKIEYASDESENVLAGTTINEVVYARIKNLPALAKTTHKVVTNSTANFKNDSGNIEFVYLSNEIDGSSYDTMKNKDNYVMTDYNYNDRDINSMHSTSLCGDTMTCAVTGNTILVSAVRVNKPTISAYENGRSTVDFYYYPIEWRISASSYFYTPSSISYESGEVLVDIPNYLNVVSYADSRMGEQVDGAPDGYTRYKFTFTGEEITEGNGAVNFSIYTNIGLNVKDGLQPTVTAIADFTVSDNSNDVHKAITPESNRKTSQTVTIHNASSIGVQGLSMPTTIEKNGTYTYVVSAYNNSITDSNPNGITYNNPVAYFILPYNGDSSYEDYSSKFNSTKVKFKVSIPSLPEGYKAYYTTGTSSTIINNDMFPANGTTSWVEWTNTTNEVTGPTGIKIVKTNTSGTPALAPGEYFGGSDGTISIVVKTTGSDAGDRFYNSFYLMTDKPSGAPCDPETMDEDEYAYCRDTNKFLFSASRSLTSIYTREISGFVFEDYDYTGLYDNLDSKLSNIPVSVCKANVTNLESVDPENPDTYVSENDECVADTTTGIDGTFLFRGLAEGSYYVKYTFNNEKYLVADKRVISPSETDSNSINSKASQLANKNIAVSSLITFDNKHTKEQFMNLGLRIKKQFSIDIKKYITNIVVNDDNGTDSYDYDNATKVTLNFKNPRNAKVRVKYSFCIENTKYFPGYVGIIADRIPTGMTFDPTAPENQDWVLYEDTAYYNGLSGSLLSPDEKHYFNLVLDLDVTTGGNYINVVAARELILMGDELPEYDFNSLNLFNGETEEPGSNENSSNSTEGGE